MRRYRRFWQALFALIITGCGSSGDSNEDTSSATPSNPLQPGSTTVIGQGDKPTEYPTTAGAGCLKDVSGKCVDLATACAPQDKVDVVVNKQGMVEAVICYPSGGPVSTAEAKPPEGRTYANNEVVVVDSKDDGNDINGDVNVDSNNVTVWGEGPAVSVINGNVTVSKNDGVLRGVRIKGNVTLAGNNATLLLSVVEGDVIVTGNNNVIASCDVYGKLSLNGQNTAVVSNRIQGKVEGSAAICQDNLALSDPDGDKVFDEGEAGAALTCGGADPGKPPKGK